MDYLQDIDYSQSGELSLTIPMACVQAVKPQSD